MILSRQIAELMVKKHIPTEALTETLFAYNLLSLLPSILKHVKKIGTEKGRADRILIESPFPLSEDALANIKAIVGEQAKETEVTINKNILAGFKARFKGKLYDGSAERIIKQLTQ